MEVLAESECLSPAGSPERPLVASLGSLSLNGTDSAASSDSSDSGPVVTTVAAVSAAPVVAQGTGPRIYVGGIPTAVSETMVRNYFSRWGKVEDVYFPREKASGRRRPFCFVTFASRKAAEKAVAQSDRHINGYTIASITITEDRSLHYKQKESQGFVGEAISRRSQSADFPCQNSASLGGGFAPRQSRSQSGGAAAFRSTPFTQQYLLQQQPQRGLAFQNGNVPALYQHNMGMHTSAALGNNPAVTAGLRTDALQVQQMVMNQQHLAYLASLQQRQFTATTQQQQTPVIASPQPVPQPQPAATSGLQQPQSPVSVESAASWLAAGSPVRAAAAAVMQAPIHLGLTEAAYAALAAAQRA